MGTSMNQAATEINVSQLNGSNGFSIEANNFFDAFGLGWYVSSAGDVNGDGFDDLLIGAGVEGSITSKCYVVFGAADAWDATFDLSTLDGSNGFVVNGFNNFRSSVSAAGDINGDGFDDLLIGSPDGGKSGYGASYVIFGQDFSSKVTGEGTAGDDVIVGTPGDDILIGNLGNDILVGGGGQDVLIGGAGDDIVGQLG